MYKKEQQLHWDEQEVEAYWIWCQYQWMPNYLLFTFCYRLYVSSNIPIIDGRKRFYKSSKFASLNKSLSCTYTNV